MLEPTGIAGVDAALRVLVDELRPALGERLHGAYLYGSLAAGGFDERTSDVDVLVVTAGEVGAADMPQLTAVHERVWARGGAWAARLEGSYLPLAELPAWRAGAAERPWVNEGRTFLAPHNPDWVIQRRILREHECVVVGPSIRERIDPVPDDAIRAAVRGIIGGWWADRLLDPGSLRSAAYGRFAVDTMCRALHALEHGRVVPKPEARAWAIANLHARQRALVAASPTFDDPLEDAVHVEVLDLVRLVVELCGADRGVD